MLVRDHRRRGLPAEQRPADLPIITLRPFTCACPRALKVLVAATVTGLLTGFLGVGGGFLVVPALVLSLGLEVAEAAGTSLVVIVATSAVALVARAPRATRRCPTGASCWRSPPPPWWAPWPASARRAVPTPDGCRRPSWPLLLGVAVASATAVLA